MYKIKSCLNCNKIGHEYKVCVEPITSWGIILIKTDNKLDKLSYIPDKYINGVPINSENSLIEINKKFHDIKFLLVGRKYSLGYVEFIRGKYNPNNINAIRYLFEYMLEHEIKMIGTHTFEELWDKFWLNEEKKSYYKKEFIESQIKFNQLKDGIGIDINLDFYVNNIKPLYSNVEWGFPKGRKSKGENNRECAIREFCEETGLEIEDINILDNIEPIVELMTGTNGIKYRHIYYVAQITNNKIPYIDKDNKNQYNEIGNIGFFTFYEALTLIRDYHIEKKNIIMNLTLSYMDTYKEHKHSQEIQIELDSGLQLEKDTHVSHVVWSCDE